MQKEFWHEKWQSNQIGFNQPKPNQLLLQYFDTLNLRPGNKVFVPLCGKSIDMVWLASQGYEVLGVELSPIACSAASVIASETDAAACTITAPLFVQYLKHDLGLYSQCARHRRSAPKSIG